MTIVMTMSKLATVTAAEFKAKCLALMDQVAASGEGIVITKRGKPVARLVPAREPGTLVGFFREHIESVGDVVSPMADGWDAEGGGGASDRHARAGLAGSR